MSVRQESGVVRRWSTAIFCTYFVAGGQGQRQRQLQAQERLVLLVLFFVRNGTLKHFPSSIVQLDKHIHQMFKHFHYFEVVCIFQITASEPNVRVRRKRGRNKKER